MSWRLAADLVLVCHLAFIVFAVAGGLLGLRWRWMPWVHLPAVAWGVYIELSGGLCPLTPLEVWLRRTAGSEGYSGSFVEHYIVPVVYPASLSPDRQAALAGALVAANLLAYSFLVWRRLRRGSSGWAG
jgi:hypothetical protein